MKSNRQQFGNERRVAVIEEMADNIYSVQFVLQSLGFTVRSFSYRTDYVTPLQEFSPDLIIVDMMIPGGAGYTVIRKLQAGPLREVPVLAITAEAMEGDEQDVYSAGGQDVLSKPYTIAQLREKLAKWFG